jgi:hypothetical protein
VTTPLAPSPPGAAPPAGAGLSVDSSTQGPLVKFKSKDVDPPSSLYITQDDQLLVRVGSWAPGQPFQVLGRLLGVDGVLRIINYSITPTGALGQTFTFPLAEGYLLSLVAFITTAPLQRGQTYVQLGLQRGTIAGGTVTEILTGDYVTGNQFVAWPGRSVQSPSDGRGTYLVAVGSVPGAGVDPVGAFLANTQTRVLGFIATLTTSAAVANRMVKFRIDNAGASVHFRSGANVVQAASLTFTYSVGQVGGLGGAIDTVNVGMSAPAGEHWIVPPASQVRFETQNLQVGDQWTAATLVTEVKVQDQ